MLIINRFCWYYQLKLMCVITFGFSYLFIPCQMPVCMFAWCSFWLSQNDAHSLSFSICDSNYLQSSHTHTHTILLQFRRNSDSLRVEPLHSLLPLLLIWQCGWVFVTKQTRHNETKGTNYEIILNSHSLVKKREKKKTKNQPTK